ncbi:hypothetical protein [Ovoidimarina sediminis]|uniref:hypothetical protein n=1 Tax=Ovoidimarina sediminis TaxID=3079856 RepID=UPI002910FD5D|nr:hypothetical protein [Rhodophyticola sp. MJ-SS7]MDU8944595.1 hypothetical protein [Rhodophyticola sp. MJ-SS7]
MTAGGVDVAATAKDTTAALKRHVLPLLRVAGFDDGTPRKLWRHRGARIDHIELSSFSTYQAATLDCPTASLAVRIGLSLPGYGAADDPFQKDHLKAGPKGLRPGEAQMPIRGVLSPGNGPPLTKGRWGWEFDWVWPIATADAAETAACDLAGQFEAYGLDWLETDWSISDILALLEGEEPAPILVAAPNGSHLKLDTGLSESPLRNAHIAMARRALDGRRRPG